jgi:glycosyltransferase involved in cell wall biosynthesis
LKPKVAVVIPAFNEEETIAAVVESLPKDIVSHAIVVDDASRDATAGIAKQCGALVLKHGRNLGVGAAIKSGYSKAMDLGADVVLVVAGDGQHDPNDIPKLIEPILADEADYVVGDRLSGDPVAHGMPRHRYYANRLLSYLTAKITGLDVKDSQCGFTAITRIALTRINMGFLSDRWGIPNDLLLECAMRGLRVKYVQIRPVYGGRKSYIRLTGFAFRLLAILVRGLLRYVYYYRGTVFFSIAGGTLIVIGLVYGTTIVVETLATGALPGAGSVVLDATIILTGVQLFIFGLLAEMMKMVEHRIGSSHS